MSPTALLVLTTLASEQDARALVTALVADRLVACGTLLPGARSIYRWAGKVTEETEVVVLLKTDARKWDALAAAVRAKHPYEVPELLALPVERGLEPYLAWLASEVGGGGGSASADRKGVGWGKGEDSGGGRIIKKKKKK